MERCRGGCIACVEGWFGVGRIESVDSNIERMCFVGVDSGVDLTGGLRRGRGIFGRAVEEK